MLDDTKLIKSILKNNFPNYKFSIQNKRPSQYIDSSDMTIIICDKSIEDEVVNILNKYTRGISIFKDDEYACRFGKICSEIYDISKEKFVDADIEFIEIKTK